MFVKRHAKKAIIVIIQHENVWLATQLVRIAKDLK